MQTLLNDLRLAVRALRRTPGFTITAVVTLGVGVALCTATMMVVNAYLLHDLPYPAARAAAHDPLRQPGTERAARHGAARLDVNR